MVWTAAPLPATFFEVDEDHLAQVGARIRALREARGLTQDQLADLVDVREKTISRWENGKNQAVLANVRALAAALEVEVQDITGQLPAPLGLGASENQVALMDAKYELAVAGLHQHLARIEEKIDRIVEVLELAAIGQISRAAELLSAQDADAPVGQTAHRSVRSATRPPADH